MSGIKITELNPILNTDLASGDVLPLVDISAPETKKVSVLELDKRYKDPLDSALTQINSNTNQIQIILTGGGFGGTVNTATSNNATPVQAGTFELELNKVAYVHAKVVAKRTSGSGAAGNSAVYFLKAKVKNTAGVITLSTVTATEFEDVTGWNADIVTIANGIAIQCTGAAGTVISWLSVTEFQTV